uniref:Uncharacterized protein n=1 Tax=Micrurus lemniscatus lemniscatus TaxID=129467 RepID=A0A2D4JEU6_MICLE
MLGPLKYFEGTFQDHFSPVMPHQAFVNSVFLLWAIFPTLNLDSCVQFWKPYLLDGILTLISAQHWVGNKKIKFILHRGGKKALEATSYLAFFCGISHPDYQNG